jgi:hypothetical protein
MIARLIALGVLVLGGCYSSAQGARVSQTASADGWACYADPRVSCPAHANGVCTGWDERWMATCPDDGSRWVCHFTGESRRVSCARSGGQ